jgi:hypothetical protein
LAQTAVCGWAAASLLKLSFPMASMKEHRLVADLYVCARESPDKRAAAPSVHALMLRSNYRFGPISEGVPIPPCKSASTLDIGVGL